MMVGGEEFSWRARERVFCLFLVSFLFTPLSRLLFFRPFSALVLSLQLAECEFARVFLLSPLLIIPTTLKREREREREGEKKNVRKRERKLKLANQKKKKYLDQKRGVKGSTRRVGATRVPSLLLFRGITQSKKGKERERRREGVLS